MVKSFLPLRFFAQFFWRVGRWCFTVLRVFVPACCDVLGRLPTHPERLGRAS